MKFSIATLLVLPASLALASNSQSTDPIAAFIDKSHETIDQVLLFGCKVKPCLEVLAPSLAICAFAAAQEELDPINDAACFAAAARDIAHKPADCAHCY